MEFIYTLAIFILVLIFYSQIVYQLKKGDDMEIYEIDYTTNKDLNDSANLKQPFLFSFSNFDSYFKMLPLSQLIDEQGKDHQQELTHPFILEHRVHVRSCHFGPSW